jgi:cell division protein FtsW
MTATTTTRAPARQGPYVLLLATVGVLNVVGMVMVLSASSVFSLEIHGSAWYTFLRQIAWTFLGVVGFAIALRIDYRKWRRISEALVLVTGVLLLLVFVPAIGVEVAGARRWLGIGSWSIQPSEMAKLALVVFTADLLSRREHEVWDWRRVLRPVLMVLGAFVVLVCLEPDLDSAFLIAIIVGVVLLIGGVRFAHLAAIGGAGIVAGTIFALSAGYRRERLLSFLDPGSDTVNAGYQAAQSLIHLGSGGIDGVGLGAGRAKWLFLPNAHTDFIFAVIGEELGMIGTFTVLGLFVALLWLGVLTAMRARDRFGMLLATGITVWIGIQAMLNMGGVVGVLPASSVPLPFISFGGSALVVTMIGVGMLANVARQAR